MSDKTSYNPPIKEGMDICQSDDPDTESGKLKLSQKMLSSQILAQVL